MKIDANEKNQQFLSISLQIIIPISKYKYILNSRLYILLDDLKEPPHIFILKDISICYIQYDEIGFPLNYKYINEQEEEVHIDYLKNWDNEVCDCLS